MWPNTFSSWKNIRKRILVRNKAVSVNILTYISNMIMLFSLYSWHVKSLVKIRSNMYAWWMGRRGQKLARSESSKCRKLLCSYSYLMCQKWFSLLIRGSRTLFEWYTCDDLHLFVGISGDISQLTLWCSLYLSWYPVNSLVWEVTINNNWKNIWENENSFTETSLYSVAQTQYL